uniref:Secreted protein n=1 Tax=Achlya hypogyna TaxID=1202772 RepID=A0A0A7CPT7_ACHHY|nr:secreted protein [Achlya hypogyna]
MHFPAIFLSCLTLISGVSGNIMQDLFREHNVQRIRHNLPPFACLDDTLSNLSAIHVQSQVQTRSLHHAQLDARCHALGTGVVCGENSLRGDAVDANAMLTAWMNSTKHRFNILDPRFTRVGFALQQLPTTKEWFASALFTSDSPSAANCTSGSNPVYPGAPANAASTGKATTYGGPDGVDVGGGNCGLMAWLENAKQFHAAINHEQWASGTNCGRCVEVTCVDDRCPSKKPTVSDQCHGCGPGSLDLTLPFFKQVTGAETDSFAISWRFIECPVKGSLQVCAKSGSNSYWLALQPANSVHGVKSMAINDEESPLFSPTSNYFFMAKSRADMGAVKVKMTAFSGESVSTTVALRAGECTSVGQQFDANYNGKK